MKVVILAGGKGTRIAEETQSKPKPLIEIGGRPILWHIMKIYSHYGLKDFVICAGYKGHLIKEFFCNYARYMSDLTVDLSSGDVQVHQARGEDWRVTIVDTGEDTMTGGRIKRVGAYLDDEPFCMTYGDGLSNVNITDLLQFHKQSGKLATLTAVQPLGRFGALELHNEQVTRFVEKPITENGWINGGFFVLQPEVLSLIDGDETFFELEPLQRLVAKQQLAAFQHEGFWQPMDTLREKIQLESLWDSGNAPWHVWNKPLSKAA